MCFDIKQFIPVSPEKQRDSKQQKYRDECRKTSINQSESATDTKIALWRQISVTYFDTYPSALVFRAMQKVQCIRKYIEEVYQLLVAHRNEFQNLTRNRVFHLFDARKRPDTRKPSNVDHITSV